MRHMTVHSGAAWLIRWLNLCTAVVKQLNHQKVMQTSLDVDS